MKEDINEIIDFINYAINQADKTDDSEIKIAEMYGALCKVRDDLQYALKVNG